MGGCHGEGAYLNWSTKVDTIFFSWWHADTPGRFLLAVVIVFLLAFVYEGISNFRSQFESALNKKIALHGYRFDASIINF